MFNFQRLRLPYRDDAAFGLLGFCLFLLPLAFSLFSFENFESIKFSLFLIMTGAAAAVFFLREPEKGKKTFKYNKYFYILLSLFGIWAILSTVFAFDHVYAIFGFYYRYTSGLVFFATLLLFIFLLANLLNKERLEFLLKVLIVDALAVALITFLQSFGWIFYAGLDIGGFWRGPSLLGNSNYSAMLLAVIFPVPFYFLYFAKSLSARIYYALSIFVIILASLILASRGAMLAMAISVVVSLVALAIFNFPKKVFYTMLIILVAALVGGYFFTNVSRPQAITGIFQGADINTSTRIYAWKISLKAIAQYPVFGAGLGNYALLFERIHAADMPGEVGVFDDAHNIFLHLAVTGGLPLALVFLLGILAGMLVALKNLKQTKDFLTLVLLCSLSAWVVAACFTPVPLPLFVILAVLLVAIIQEHLIPITVKYTKVFKILMVIFALILSIWGLVTFVSEHLLGLSRSAFQNQNYSQSFRLANSAFLINPTNEEFLNYMVASEIYLGKNKSVIRNDIQKFVKLHPKQSGSYANASNLFYELYNKENDKDDLISAVNNLEAALKIDPLFTDRYGRLALYYYELGDYKKSEENVEQVLTLSPDNFSGWILRARLYQLKGNRDGVVSSLTKAYKLKPDIQQLKYLLYLAKNLKDLKQVPIQINVRSPGL